MNIIDRRLGRSSGSATVTKQRLQLVLTQDRPSISPETLNLWKDEIIAAISKYVEIETGNVEVTISSNNQGNQLTANIPVVGTRTARASSGSVRARRQT